MTLRFHSSVLPTFASVMDAVLTYWRDPSQVKPCAQAAITNMERAALLLRMADVTATTEIYERRDPASVPVWRGTRKCRVRVWVGVCAGVGVCECVCGVCVCVCV